MCLSLEGRKSIWWQTPSCSPPKSNSGLPQSTDLETGNELGLAEAKELAIASECGDRLLENIMCNENTGTWWIDLEIDKPGCAPACVVNVNTKEAVINWRCTGLLPE